MFPPPGLVFPPPEPVFPPPGLVLPPPELVPPVPVLLLLSVLFSSFLFSVFLFSVFLLSSTVDLSNFSPDETVFSPSGVFTVIFSAVLLAIFASTPSFTSITDFSAPFSNVMSALLSNVSFTAVSALRLTFSPSITRFVSSAAPLTFTCTPAALIVALSTLPFTFKVRVLTPLFAKIFAILLPLFTVRLRLSPLQLRLFNTALLETTIFALDEVTFMELFLAASTNFFTPSPSRFMLLNLALFSTLNFEPAT